MLVEFDDLMCLTDIAQLLGVTRQRASQLYYHKKLPEPLGKKGKGMLWLKADIVNWNVERSKKYKQKYFPAKYTPFKKQTEILTPREMEVLMCYVNHDKNITKKLRIRKSTVRVVIRNIKKKLGIRSIKELADKALEFGLISIEDEVNNE